jgi:iron complex outermembrane receptor protein
MISFRRKFTYWFPLVTIALSPAYLATPTLGQELEEIIVTARQRAEALQDVPATVQVFTGERIENSGVQRASDFVNLTPGVTIVDAAEVGDTQVNIRGINGARDAENSFALIIDGILMTNPASLNREYTNLQQIEILKGPQGALYGRNAAAGAIIITTQKPGEETSGAITVSGAEDATYYLAGHVGGKASDTVSWSVSGDYRETDGYYENVIDRFGSLSFGAPGGATVDNFENWNIQGRLIFEPSDATTIDAKLRYGEVDGSAITFNPAFALPGFVNAQGFPIPEFYENVNDHNFFFQPNIDSSNDQEALELSVKIDHQMDWGAFTGWALYSDIENSLGSDGTSGAFEFFGDDPLCISSHTELLNIGNADPSTFPPGAFSILPAPQFHGASPKFPDGVYGPYLPSTCDGTQYQERNQEDVSVELRITSNDDQRLRWSAGFYYLTIEREVGVNLGIDTGNGINQNLFVSRTDNMDGTFSSNNPTEQLLRDDFETDAYALFGQLNYDLTDNVEVSLAVRWDREERDVDNTVPTPSEQVTRWISYPTPGFNLGGSPLNPGLDPTIVGAGNLNPDGSIPSQSATFDEIQPKVSLTWDVADSTTIFGSYGVGFKSGGFNNSGSAATIDTFFNCALGIGSFFGQPFGASPSCGDYSGFGGPIIDNSQFPEWVITDQFREETSDAFEIGIRSTVLDGRMRLEAAYYHTNVDDMQFFEFTVGSFGLLRVVSNIDEVTIDGFEASVDWQVTDNLSLYAGGNWTDSEIDKNSSRPDTVGNESPYTAEYTGNVGGRIVFPIGGGDMNFFANVDWNFVGDTWFHVVQANDRPTVFGPVAGFRLSLPGDIAGPLSVATWDRAMREAYNVGNVRIGLETERWTITAFATNVTDEEYLEEVIPAPEFGGAFIHPGTLQRMGLEATIRF